MNKAQLWQQADNLTLLRGWVRDGVSTREIARRMGIMPVTLSIWRRRHPALDQALCQTGELTDYRVEDALLKAALGYCYTEEKREQTDKGEKLVSTQKDVSPSVSAISLWLKRRRPQVWDEDAPAQEQRENNLYEALGQWQEEVITADEIPELQPPAAADHDLVEAGAVPGL